MGNNNIGLKKWNRASNVNTCSCVKSPCTTTKSSSIHKLSRKYGMLEITCQRCRLRSWSLIGRNIVGLGNGTILSIRTSNHGKQFHSCAYHMPNLNIYIYIYTETNYMPFTPSILEQWCRFALWYLMMLKIVSKPHSPYVFETTLAQHRKKKKTLQRVPVWYRPNTLRMSS